jgi:hypothetical protein
LKRGRAEWVWQQQPGSPNIGRGLALHKVNLGKRRLCVLCESWEEVAKWTFTNEYTHPCQSPAFLHWHLELAYTTVFFFRVNNSFFSPASLFHFPFTFFLKLAFTAAAKKIPTELQPCRRKMLHPLGSNRSDDQLQTTSE